MAVDINGTTGLTFNNGSTQDVGGIGIGQTWQGVSRAYNTTYTNSTGKPIFVSVVITTLAGTSANLQVESSLGSGTFVSVGSDTGAANITSTQSTMVPNGFRYRVVTINTPTLQIWVELR
jgi:hypothetical protein